MRVLVFATVVMVVSVPSISSTPTDAPLDLEARLSADSSNVTLTWSAVDATGSSFRVYKGGVRVADVTNTTWFDATPGPLTAYTVTTVDATGEGPGSVVVVSAVEFCGTVPLEGRGVLYFVSVEGDTCEGAPQACNINEPGSCVPGFCPPIYFRALPPEAGVRQECIPDGPSGSRTFRVAG